jgi:hypothetical protein
MKIKKEREKDISKEISIAICIEIYWQKLKIRGVYIRDKPLRFNFSDF